MQNVQSVVEVFSEAALTHRLLKFGVGCGYQSHIDINRRGAPQPGNFLFLQNAQQFCLCFLGEVPDFVKKEGSSMSQIEHARMPGDRTCKGTLFVAK